MLVDGVWRTSQVRSSDATGYYQIPLTYGMYTVGEHRFRVGAYTPIGTIYSDEFTLVRTTTVVAGNAGTKSVGATTNVWGRVNGVPEGRVFTQVLVDGVWRTSQVRSSDATGYYQIPLTYGTYTVGEHRFRVGADTPIGTIYSDEFTLLRTTTVVAGNAGTKSIGATTNVWGSVNGVPEGRVFTQVLVDGVWRTSQVRSSDATGYYQIPLTYGTYTVGEHRFRVGADTPIGTIYSDEFTLLRTTTVVAGNAGTKSIGATTNVWGSVNGVPEGRVFTQVLVDGVWRTSQVRSSDATGYYQIPLTYGMYTVGEHRFRVGAYTPIGTIYSDEFTLVRTTTVVAGNAGTKSVGATTNVWGRVNGVPEGRVFTQVLVDGVWRTSQVRSSDATGYYQIPLTYGTYTVGEHRFRVGADTPIGTIYSDEFTLTRTAKSARQVRDCSRHPNGKSVMVDKQVMRAWLCQNGIAVSGLLPFTSGPTYQAPQGIYRVYFKRNPWWSDGGRYQLDNFTGFTTGVNGGRIGFHKYVIMPEYQVGSESWRNRSGGCFRMRTRDVRTLYQFADIGTIVHVLNNG